MSERYPYTTENLKLNTRGWTILDWALSLVMAILLIGRAIYLKVYWKIRVLIIDNRFSAWFKQND